ncbi:MAG: hypothetical protein AB8B65_17510 [Kordia sp.]
MINWLSPVAISIGFFFVYLSNQKIGKKITDYYTKKKKDDRDI